MRIYKRKEASLSTFVDELAAYCVALKENDRKSQLALATYWLKQLEEKKLSESTSQALWAGIQIGAAVERANAERVWTKPLTKQAKAKQTRLAASKLQAEQKKLAADESILKDWGDFSARNPKKDITWLWSKFKQSLGGARQRRFSKLVPKSSLK